MDKNNCGKPQFSGEWVRLGDVASYINGYAFKPADYASEGKPIIRIQDLTGNAYQTNRFAGNLDDKYRVVWGDVLISWSASLGVYVWSAEEAWLNQHIFKVQFNKLPVNKRFFIHQTRYVIAESASLAHGATMRHLTKKVFDNLPFFYPSEHDQEEIACHLDGIQLQIDSASDMLARLDALVKSRFIEMFGDPNSKQCKAFIEDAFFIRDDLRKPLSGIERDAMKTGELYPYYGANGKVDDINQFLTDCDALCFAEDCGSYGPGEPTAYVIRGKAWVNNHAHLLVAKCPHFLEYARTYFTLLDVNRFISGTTRAKMTQAQLKKVNIEVPDQVMLREFDGFVSNVDKLRFDVQQQIDKLELLKNSLMQEYFG